MGIQKPLPLNRKIVSLIKNNIGNYELGDINQEGNLVPTYVGRGKVQDRLYEHIDDEYKQPYFLFWYAENEEEACNKECEMYHEYIDQLENKVHPSLPKGKKCPYCSHVGSE